MEQVHLNQKESLKDDGLAPCFGPEKEEWRKSEGYYSNAEGLRLTQDASQGLILIDDD